MSLIERLFGRKSEQKPMVTKTEKQTEGPSDIESLLLNLPELGQEGADKMEAYVTLETPHTLEFRGSFNDTLKYLKDYVSDSRKHILQNAPNIKSVDVQFRSTSWPMGWIGFVNLVRKFRNGGVDIYPVYIVRASSDHFLVFHSRR